MTAQLISRTGRVQSWLDNPESRLPVSCTVFVVEDSMEGENGIEKSWRYVSHGLRFGAGVAVHLSKLRPKGAENGRGLTASGPVSFGKIYSTLNETLRRGGIYKNGAVVLHLDLNHPDIYEFITTPREELPWVKRCVDIDSGWWQSCDNKVKDALLYGIKSGDIWLNKVKYQNGERIYGNVCLEVYLPSRGTCLLQHVNLAACDTGNIEQAFDQGMSQLCELHSRTGVGATGEYLPADIAEENNMVRAFAIAPTASCSYRSEDLDGFTATPEIAPPISRTVDRDSGTFGVQSYNYGDVEIASEVGWDAYKKVADQLMIMYDNTGLLHGYSFNSWSDVVAYDREFVEEWLLSPQTSLYYSLQVMGDTQDKTDAYAALDQGEVDDYLQDILGNEPVTCDCQE